jgi:hypothetical protein
MFSFLKKSLENCHPEESIESQKITIFTRKYEESTRKSYLR